MNRDRMEQGIRIFLEGIGKRFEGDDLEATPPRVARAWSDDLLCGYATDPEAEMSWSEAPAGSGPVVVRDVSFSSMCVHHLLPFAGHAHVAYVPNRRLAGLSKIGRVVEAHTRRLQIQERLTSEIVATLDRTLEPHGTLVVLEAEHTCMTLRGARKQGSRLVTLAASGTLRDDAAARREILELLGLDAERTVPRKS
jgi:GTP cyclohydrolase I